MDTGSGLIWTQCKPCLECYHQIEHIYDSQTYNKISCSHALCQRVQSQFMCVNNECVYKIQYGGGQSDDTPTTKDIASLESFQFSADGVRTTVVKDMIFI
ncbi:hypothetical protein V6N11_042525 [Hibiscus sabdariffa]|uniref:Peptidase A1 domain-containing protein n=1 Tax=Hibiscus sabdariffa TaxID=183260 RepID=A0ABR2QX92_9ROSI